MIAPFWNILLVMTDMWQDNEVRFDISHAQMQLRLGEFIVDKLDSIEDAKGNAGDSGRLTITNLRIIWHSLHFPRINLSIGYNTFIIVNARGVHSLQGKYVQALHILASFRSCRYEFMFINQDLKNTRHYTSVIGVYRAYISSRVYREIRLRSGIISDKQLIILPRETLLSMSQEIWNLSLEQGNIGTFIVTNIRLVWYADMNSQFNISIPYLIIANIAIKNSKFGPTLVITTTNSSGGCILGFRVNPIQKLHVLYKEIFALLKTFEKCPIFGIYYTLEHQAPFHQELNVEQQFDTQESQFDISNIFGYYFSEGSNKKKPSFSTYIGLAAEEPKETSTLQSLWELVPQS